MLGCTVMLHYSGFGGATNMQNRGTLFGFFLAIAMVSSKWTLVSLHPLGLEARGVGIHQRQPNYLPTYNGIFSIHALNFTSPTSPDTTFAASGHQQTTVSNSSSSSDHREADEHLDSAENLDSQLFPEDGTDANEVDSKDRLKIPEQTTFPQLHVVTHTIFETTPEEDTTETEEEEEEEYTVDSTDEEIATNETTTEQAHTNSESLLEGSEGEEEDPKKESEDIFDRLMKTIQGHWLDFVGKMKLSVLDVWKSISHHMMERLENFATGL